MVVAVRSVDLWQSADVTLPRRDVDPDGLLEYSVVFTDRSLNHMSKRFVGVMQDIIDVLCTTYRAESVAVVPGGGTYAMEAVARQLATTATDGAAMPGCPQRSVLLPLVADLRCRVRGQ